MDTYLHGYRKLSSNNFSLLYHSGEVRQISVGNIQVIHAIYGAVRDRNWGTVPCRIMEESIREAPEGIRIKLRVCYKAPGIDFEAQIDIRTTGRQLEFSFEGMAKQRFLKNRIGICLLHPLSCKGSPLSISHPDGSSSSGTFPEMVSPHQPFLNISGINWKVAAHLEAEIAFEGEIFEMEDQRNWSDASYKTYGTPLELPFPAWVEEGEQVKQSISLVVKETGREHSARKERVLSLSLVPNQILSLPAIGFGISTSPELLSGEDAEILKGMSPNHLRLDVHLGNPQWKQHYQRASEEQKLLAWPLELALFFHQQYEDELKAFLELFKHRSVKISHILVFDSAHMTSPDLLKQVIPELRSRFPGIPIGGGTDANFAELNRMQLDGDSLDFVSYSICPQVHAFDNLTLIENLEAQSETVISAKKLFTLPVAIGAITLKKRFNVVATEESNSQPYPLSDTRQHTAFVAGWTLGSIKQLSMAGIAYCTYFETIGPRGLMDPNTSPTRTSPLLFLFIELLNHDTREILATRSSDPMLMDGLMLKGTHGNRLLLVNYTGSQLIVNVDVHNNPPESCHQLTDTGWTKLPLQELQAFPLNPSSIYKIHFSS